MVSQYLKNAIIEIGVCFKKAFYFQLIIPQNIIKSDIWLVLKHPRQILKKKTSIAIVTRLKTRKKQGVLHSGDTCLKHILVEPLSFAFCEKQAKLLY